MNPSLSGIHDQFSLRGVPAESLRPLSAIAATRGGAVPQARICRVFLDVAGPLVALHQASGPHGAISCDTIALDASGRADVLRADAHTLRQADATALRDGRAYGFNAFEQYTSDPDWAVGAWTDVYALSAVACCLVTGHAPPSAIDRCVNDTYRRVAELAPEGYTAEFLSAIDAGLALRPGDRPQDVPALLHAMGIDNEVVVAACAAGVQSPNESAESVATPTPASTAASAGGAPRQVARASDAPSTRPRELSGKPEAGQPSRWLVIPTVLALIVLCFLVWVYASEPAFPKTSSQRPTGATYAPSASLGTPDPSGDAGTLHPRTDPFLPLESQAIAMDQVAALKQSPVPVGTEPPRTDAGAPHPAPLTPPTPAATPAQVAAQVVEVDVAPWGEIYVNGIKQGVSPPLKRISLSPGTYRVSVRNPSAPAHVFKLTVEAGKRATISHRFTAP